MSAIRACAGAKPAGFTLLEVLVAVALLSIGGLAAVTMQQSAVRGNQGASSVQVASELAGDLLEAARGLDWEDSRLAATDGWVTPASSVVQMAGASPGVVGFTRTWRITDDTPIANVKQIEVRTVWNERGNTRTVILTTLRAEE